MDLTSHFLNTAACQKNKSIENQERVKDQLQDDHTFLKGRGREIEPFCLNRLRIDKNWVFYFIFTAALLLKYHWPITMQAEYGSGINF